MKFLLVFASFFFISCSFQSQKLKIYGKTMGTTYTITYYTHEDILDQKDLKKNIDQQLEKLNLQMSTYLPHSEISKFNLSKKNEWNTISPWFIKVLSHALHLAKLSKGVFDPTVGPLVNLWGFGPNKKRSRPSSNEIKKALKYVGYKKIILDLKNFKIKKTHDKTMLDLSASAKGFGVDLIANYLEKNNIKDYLVEIGGEIKVHVQNYKDSWKLAIESPNKLSLEKNIHKIITLRNGALATSGNYRNYFKENGKFYGHTINFKTGSPVINASLSVSIIDELSCMNADALATLLMSLNKAQAIDYIKTHHIKAYIISEDKAGNEVIDNFLNNF